MANRKAHNEKIGDEVLVGMLETMLLCQLDIVGLTGHNPEARGREQVNRLLKVGRRLLHTYM